MSDFGTLRELMLSRARAEGETLNSLLARWRGEPAPRPDPSVMDSYRPPVPQTGYVNTEEPLGPPSVLGGLLSLDPTDYVGPNTLAKLAVGAKGLLSGAALMPMANWTIHKTTGGTRIIENPTREQALNLANKSKAQELRAIRDKDTGNLYVWDAYELTHDPAAYSLGLDFDRIRDQTSRGNGDWGIMNIPAKSIEGYPLKMFSGD